MSGTDPYSMGNLISDPNFDFINKINSQYDDDRYNNHLSFLDVDNSESPYNSNTFSCNYVDIDQLCTQMCLSENIVVMSLNIQSLPAKFSELCEFIDLCTSKDSLPDIILLQEVWQIMDPNAFSIPGYQTLIYKCREKGQGGGVGIYVKSGINFVINPCSVFMEKVFESLFIDIVINKRKFTVGSVYRCISRHPTLSARDQLTVFNELLLNLLSETCNGELVLGGDINLDVLKIHSEDSVMQYIDNLFSNGCLQVVTKPTRCTINTASCIDHFITNVKQPNFFTSILVSKMSDHFPIFFSIIQSKVKS
jgi:exonuclease III